MTTRVLFCLVLASALLAAPGCLMVQRHFGRDLPEPAELESTLQVGVTTKAEALAVLGAPMSVRRQFDGDLYLWVRSYEENESLVIIPIFTIYLDSKGSSRSDRLALLFDHRGILSGVGDERDIVRSGSGRPRSAVGEVR